MKNIQRILEIAFDWKYIVLSLRCEVQIKLYDNLLNALCDERSNICMLI